MIVVFGSINVDLSFFVSHLPVQGETVLGQSYLMSPGGKGANQAVAAARMGGDVVMVGAVGNDIFAAAALEILRRERVDLALVREVDLPTGCAALGVDRHGRNQILVASGANQQARADQIPDGLFTPSNCFLLQMEVSPEENWKILHKAREAGSITVLNAAPASPIPRSVLERLNYLVLNEIEARSIADAFGMAEEDAVQSGARIGTAFNLTTVVTLGARGAAICDRGTINYSPGIALQALDTTGAGDTFSGVFAASLESGATVDEAVRQGCLAASLSCLKPGAQSAMPTRNDLLDWCRSHERSEAADTMRNKLQSNVSSVALDTLAPQENNA